MGRPKKSEMGSIPTMERILQKAMELFAHRGFDAVSVRDITSSLDLNQATLYLYFNNKAALLDAIFHRLEENLIKPGFTVLPIDFFESQDSFDLAEFLIEGAQRFFTRANQETRQTWRILLTSQYRHESARNSVETQLLNAPISYFVALIENMKAAGKLRLNVDPSNVGQILAAIFFEYSFRANLQNAWEGENPAAFEKLCQDLRQLARLLV